MSLRARDELTRALHDEPYSMSLYLLRGRVYADLGYPDLAVGDVYKTLLLADEVLDESAEYHHQAEASALAWLSDAPSRKQLQDALALPVLESISAKDRRGADVMHEASAYDNVVDFVRNDILPRASMLLAYHLAIIGCLRSGYEYAQNASKCGPRFADQARDYRRHIASLAKPDVKPLTEHVDLTSSEVQQLSDRGHVRREVYPWNSHEQNRLASSSVNDLNAQLSVIAPKLEVRITQLPALASRHSPNDDVHCEQLGLFAKEDIRPGESVLCERTMLTASARLHDPVCDACSATLPLPNQQSGAQSPEDDPVACPDCDDTVFCSDKCRELGQTCYHASTCGTDVDSIAKEVPASQAVDALYTQLLFRTLAMSLTQDMHALDLRETKYTWGDFEAPAPAECGVDPNRSFADHARTLPFDFRSQVLQPLHFLEMHDINIFEAPHDLAETWVYNTLFAKFRGTASARMNPRDGRPEVAAVHPIWCLANHSCDPNVEWEWAGEITFTAKSQGITWRRTNSVDGAQTEKPPRPGGIRRGEEIMNHYVDIDLAVADRREWGAGALGGYCRCQRCLWESVEID